MYSEILSHYSTQRPQMVVRKLTFFLLS